MPPKIKKKLNVSRIASQADTRSKKISLSTVKRKEVKISDLVPTPCVPFNLECSGRHEGAFHLGKIVNLIGDSHAGKTLFALSIIAECAMDKRFDNYRFIYDDVEAANEFDINYLFGSKCANRIEASDEIRSWTIEDFNDNIARCLDGDKPFVYILDSFDALTSESAIKKDSEDRKKREKGQETGGSYGDGKPKIMSDFFKLRTQDLYDKKSLIIIISQTRDNIGFGAMFNPKTRSGGKALKFFSCHEIWLAMQKKEKKGTRTYVTNVQAKITKNKLTGRHGEALFQILFDHGIDYISSCINFMVKEGGWSGSKNSINTKGFTEENMSYSKLIDYIENNELEKALAEQCQSAYDSIIESLRPKRKRRYL